MSSFFAIFDSQMVIFGGSGGYLAEVKSRSDVDAILNLAWDANNVDVTTVLLGSRRVNGTWEFLTSGDPMTYFDWGDHSNGDAKGDCLFLGESKKMEERVCEDVSLTRVACEVIG